MYIFFIPNVSSLSQMYAAFLFFYFFYPKCMFVYFFTPNDIFFFTQMYVFLSQMYLINREINKKYTN